MRWQGMTATMGAMLMACGSTPIEGTGGAGGTTTSESTTTSAPEGCPDPQRSYVPAGYGDAPVHVGLHDVLAGMMDPFEEDAACATLLVGMFEDDASCFLPETMSILAWSEQADYPIQDVAGVVLKVADAEDLGGGIPGAHLFAFHMATGFPAGAVPFVGFINEGSACGLSRQPVCDPFKAWRRTESWAPLEVTTGIKGQLVFGLEDCQHE